MGIAFAGNPNSGKTTMYNVVTGSNEKVGNWAGVTVDRKEAPIRKTFAEGQQLTAVDLPGTYSMSPFTSDESVTRDYVKNEKPDVIINIVDATNLSRSLFFTTQLLELGIPVVVALNKADMNEKNAVRIDTPMLSALLGCPVLETVSTDSDHDDLKAVIRTAARRIGQPQPAPFRQKETDFSSKEAAEKADRQRFAFVNELVAQVECRKCKTKALTLHDTADMVLTHPVAGLLIFAAVMFFVFQISQAWLGPWIAEGYTFSNGFTIPGLVTLIDLFKEWVAGLLTDANPFLSAMLTEGVIGGVSAVVGFLPLVMVMYFLVGLLEDCGYMSRATVVLDPIFKKVGLSGKSVIPFVVGTGCAIPGVMACRTIRNERERKATAMLTPFMPCGAKLPVIALFAGAFFEDAPWVGTLMYFAGIFIILLGALLVNKIAGSRRKQYFIIELPDYKVPSLKRAALQPGRGLCGEGRYSYFNLQHGRLCDAVLQLGFPADPGGYGAEFHSGKHCRPDIGAADSFGHPCLADGSSCHHRHDRQGECGGYTGGLLRHLQPDRHRGTGNGRGRRLCSRCRIGHYEGSGAGLPDVQFVHAPLLCGAGRYAGGDR